MSDPWEITPEPTDYDNASHIPDGDSYFPRWQSAASEFRAEMEAAGRDRRGLVTGSHPREALDLFLPESDPAGLALLVHGGFWRISGREDWSHLARGAVERGWAVALPSYPLCPEARIGEITASVARSLDVAAGMVAGPIALAGHSAGGHLVARMTCPDVPLAEATRARITRCLPISPLSDLAPLQHVPLQADWQIDMATVQTESPRRYPDPAVQVHVVVGGAERPAFVAQAEWLVASWTSATLEVAPSRHHFDVIDPLSDSGSSMVAWLTNTDEGLRSSLRPQNP